jgi:hypothetical protein
MRIVLVAAGCVAGLVILAAAVVAGVGAMLPKRHVASRSASYRVAPEQLFALIAGPQSWRPDVAKSETVADEIGRPLLRETNQHGETMTYALTDSIPPRLLKRTIVGKSLPFTGSWTYQLEPDGSGTVVRITEDAEVYNPVFRFMSRFVIGHTSTMDAYLRALGKATGEDVTIR